MREIKRVSFKSKIKRCRHRRETKHTEKLFFEKVMKKEREEVHSYYKDNKTSKGSFESNCFNHLENYVGL